METRNIIDKSKLFGLQIRIFGQILCDFKNIRNLEGIKINDNMRCMLVRFSINKGMKECIKCKRKLEILRLSSFVVRKDMDLLRKEYCVNL